MNFLLTLIGHPFSLHFPQNFMGWGIIGFYCVLIALRLHYWQKKKRVEEKSTQILVALLVILVPFCATFLGVSLNLQNGSESVLYSGTGNMVFVPILAAIPWVIAGGLMSPIYAVLASAFTGLIISGFTQHSMVVPFEYALIALMYCELLRMRYRGWIYRFLRHPLVAVLGSSLLLAVFVIIDYSLGYPSWLDGLSGTSFLKVLGIFILMLFPFIVAGILASLLSSYYPASWVKPGPILQDSSENAISRRFFTSIGPFVAFIFFSLMVGAWFVISSSTRNSIKTRMENTASLAADGIPFFINTGSDLLSQYSHTLPLDAKNAKEIQLALAQDLRSIQFFKHLAYVDVSGKLITAYPEGSISVLNQQQMDTVKQAVEGGVLNAYSTYYTADNHQVRVVFAVSVKDQLDRVIGALVGETDLETNPYTQSLIHLLTNASKDGGNEGYVVDGQGRVIFHPNPEFINSTYPGEITPQQSFYTFTTSSNVQLLIFYYPTKIDNWAVVLAVPALEVQSVTWGMVLPLFGLFILVALMFYVVFKSGLSSMARSIKTLTNEADRIAKGQMDNNQYIRGDDEIGQLGSTFEQMRMNIKDRLEEQNLLLSVSQGIASNIDLDPALAPILQAALSNGGAVARIVLVPESEDDSLSGLPLTFASGEMMKYYAYLDDQVLALTRNRDVVTLNGLTRGRVLRLDADRANPSAIISVPVRQKNHLLGVLWVAYDAPRAFPETEIRFLNTLASDIALALTNFRLVRSAELGKKRLHAILESTADPIFMIDQNETILLANNPARDLFKGNELFIEGRKIQDVIRNPELLMILRGQVNNTEIHLNNNRVFYATVSEISNETSNLGKVCILRDVSQYKEEDSRKSEFVTNVSHDLRSPLTLMRGNATMIKMVGELNEQQKNYVDKILVGIESMSRMVNNLLDLSRIEEGYGLQLESVNSGDIVNNVLADLELQSLHKNITIKKQTDGELPPTVQADAALLQQAIYNLVENAVKYSPIGGEVTIGIRENAGFVQFEVKDQGRGIAPIDIPHLFEKSSHNLQRDGFAQKSFSMGLAIVKSVAEKHGGKTWVHSILGEGSTFFLQIPAKNAPSELEGSEKMD